MPKLTTKVVRQLLADHTPPCISLYMPTFRTGRQSHQNSIRFKNLVNSIEDRLRADNWPGSRVQKILQPARELQGNHQFWQYQSDGLAVFMTPEQFLFYHLPLQLEELVFVSDRFHIKPLLPLVQNDGPFFILAVSLHETRFFQATRQQIQEIEVDKMPDSMSDALGLEYEKSLQLHSYHPRFRARGGTDKVMFHGHEDTNPKEDIKQYFHAINSALENELAEERAPLIFAGVESLFGIFRETCHYPSVTDGYIPGNPERWRPEELHQSAWNIVQPLFQQEQRQAIERLQKQAAKNGSSNDLTEILPAAQDGRVGTLFIARGRQQWGTFEAGTREIHFDQEQKEKNEDLLDLATALTIRFKGDVYVVDPEDVPGGKEVAALFRYSTSPAAEEGSPQSIP